MKETILIFKTGNYVNSLDDKEIQFDEDYDMRVINTFESFKYKGIELTTDWLLAFGFIENKDKYIEKIFRDSYIDSKNQNEVSGGADFYKIFGFAMFYRKNNFLTAYNEYEKLFVRVEYDEKIEYFRVYSNYISKYVHDLQNLYHSVTDKQLIKQG